MTETTNETDWYGPDMATFGDRLTGAREAAGMTQEQLARRVGVKLATLKGWEEDAAEPRANKLSMLSGLLNVSMVWLMTGEGEGLGAPDEEPLPVEVAEILGEIRAMRTKMTQQAEKLGRLEKALRLVLKDKA